MKKPILLGICLGLAVAFLLVDLFGIRLLKQRNSLARTVPVDDIRAIHPHYRFNLTEMDELKDTISGNTPKEIMGSLMNITLKTGNYSSPDPMSVFRYVKGGGGIGCGGLSTLYSGALAVHQMAFRQVSLQRNYYDLYNTHTAVEVWVDGKWVLYDPSLNISYSIAGELIGAQDVSDALHEGRINDITPLDYGDVAYPVGIKGKNEKWFTFLTNFDNVYIVENENPSFIEKIPPFRYWLGPRLYYEKKIGSENQPNQHEFHETLYFSLIVVLPGLIIIFSGAALCLGLALAWERKRV